MYKSATNESNSLGVIPSVLNNDQCTKRNGCMKRTYTVPKMTTNDPSVPKTVYQLV